MNIIQAVEMIKRRFSITGSPAQIPLLKGGMFTAELVPDGIVVDNLDNQPFLPWAVFQEAVCILIQNGGRGLRGNAMEAKLGMSDLPCHWFRWKDTSHRWCMVNGLANRSFVG